jgi:hypothetical protein
MNENKIEKQVFTYPLLFRIIFKFGNIIITILLVIYSLLLLVSINSNKFLVVPLLLTVLIIYFLNRHYFNLYKILPYKIEVDDERIICSQYFLSRKEVIIYYTDIDELTGGVFENKISGIMRVCDNKNHICFGFYRRLRNSNKLSTILLSKVKREIYDEILQKLLSKKKQS